MAANDTTTTQTLDVVIVDAFGNEYTFKLENYRQNVTFAEVQTAFNVGINSGYWYSRAGYQFVSMKKASTVVTTKAVTPLT